MVIDRPGGSPKGLILGALKGFLRLQSLPHRAYLLQKFTDCGIDSGFVIREFDNNRLHLGAFSPLMAWRPPNAATTTVCRLGITLPRVLAFKFYHHFASCTLIISALSISPFKVRGRNQTPFQTPAAWVLFSSVFLCFSFHSHFNWRLTLKEVSIPCLLANAGAGQAADWPHLGPCQKLASHPRKFQNSYLY